MKYIEIVASYLDKLDELKAEDYKIIKCYEAQLLEEEMPYDYVSLINKRKVTRLEIENLLQRKIALEQSGKEEEDQIESSETNSSEE
jgi:hypothetical protein